MSISENFPEVSFIDNTTLESVQNEMVSDYIEKYEEVIKENNDALTDEKIVLSMSDPYRMILYACALQVYQTMLYIDNAGKQNFLKYAYGEYLDDLGEWKGVVRRRGKASVVTMLFTLSSEQESAVTISKGTRVTAGDNVFFETIETVEIQPGQITNQVKAACTDTGSFSNGYAVGTINTLVDPIPFIKTVSNTDMSAGGEDVEKDESLEERVYLAPSGFSCAGPSDAYIYWAKTYNTRITDVKVSSDSDATVNITFLVDNGIPTEEDVTNLKEYLMNNKIRPLTDKVVVSAPEECLYDIDVTYYINESDRIIASSIQENVNEAIEAFISWQKEKIGRDINASYLNKLICDAGAKRCIITYPVYTKLNENNIAVVNLKTITYGGIEND